MSGEKPILFSTPMVRATLDGRKTQTRRVIKPQPHSVPDGAYVDMYNKNPEHFTVWTRDHRMCLGCGGSIKGAAHWKPRYFPEDVLYVRETWAFDTGDDDGYGIGSFVYRANNGEEAPCGRWRPSIHMPREAARIFLRVTDVRAERVQDITVEDCIAEGMDCNSDINNPDPLTHENIKSWNHAHAQFLYQELWDALHAKRGFGWVKNPWVFVYEFEVVEG